MRTPNWERIDRDRAVAEAFSFSADQRAAICRRAANAEVAEHGERLADVAEAAARAYLERRALLADLPTSERKPSAAPMWSEVVDVLNERIEKLAEIERLAKALEAAIVALRGDECELDDLVSTTIGALERAARGEECPAPDDEQAWAELGAVGLQGALRTINHVGRSARFAMMPFIDEPPKVHDLGDLILAIDKGLAWTLPPDCPALLRHTKHPAAPSGLLVQMTGVALSAMSAAGFEVPDSKDLRKTVARIIGANRRYEERFGQRDYRFTL